MNDRSTRYSSCFFVAYFLLFGALFAEASDNADELPEFLEDFPKESFHRLESDGRVIGKNSYQWGREGDQLTFTERSEMKVGLFGQHHTLSTELKAVSDMNFELQSFEYTMESADSTMEVVGQRADENFRLSKKQSGQSQRRNVLIQEPLLVSSMVRPFALQKGLPKDGSVSQSAVLLEPSASTSVPMQVKTSSLEEEGTWLVEVSYLEQTLQSWIDENGSVIRERTKLAGMEIEAAPISEETYQMLDIEGTKGDLVEQSKVEFPKIEDSRNLKEFAVKISGVGLEDFQLQRHRQQLEGDVLTVKVEDESVESKSVQSLAGADQYSRYLEGEVSVPVHHPEIQKKAREIVKDENDLWARAKKVHEFVYKTLDKNPQISMPDALETLKTKQGDCNEHAVLFTALARAAGIPTRMVVGLVYSNSFYHDGEAGFYYHAWVEVFTGEGWVAMDPTWNQAPADATHLAFVEGGVDRQIQIASIMGSIELSPIETKESDSEDEEV